MECCWRGEVRSGVVGAVHKVDFARGRWTEKVEAECQGATPNMHGAVGAGAIALGVILVAVPGPVAALTLVSAKGAIGAALTQLDPKSRYAANEHYRRAGDYFVRHARTLAGRPGADEHWADSLWMAADSYDLGGWNVLAITHFVEYVAGRSEADPRRPEAVFRLAQLHHADMDYEAATRYYDQVIMEHPRSHVASRSHVPLARCLLMLDRRPEAEQHLIQVVSGQQHLRPDAVDYRDALIELGTLYHDDSRYVAAIERLDEAVRRYPDDDRITEIRFRLGDSYKRHAASIDDDLDLPGVSPAGRDQLEKQRTQYLESAQDLFAAIVEADDGLAASAGPDAQQILR